MKSCEKRSSLIGSLIKTPIIDSELEPFWYIPSKKMIFLLLMLLNWKYIHSSQYYPGNYPQIYPPPPYAMMPPVPFHYPPPYYLHYPPPFAPAMMMNPMVNPQMNSIMNPGAVPGAEAIAAALNLPSTDENIAGQLGNALQLPITEQQTNIPPTMLSANVPRPKSSQIGSTLLTAPSSNEPEKVPLPVLY